MTHNISNLVRNAFLDNPNDDWVAVAANGHPIARAGDEETLRRAAPDAAHFVKASDLSGAPAPSAPAANPVSADNLDWSAVVNIVAAQSAFDHDGDGHEGGSPKGDDSTAHKGAVKKAAARTAPAKKAASKK